MWFYVCWVMMKKEEEEGGKNKEKRKERRRQMTIQQVRDATRVVCDASR